MFGGNFGSVFGVRTLYETHKREAADMSKQADVLAGIRIAKPCPASWAAMRGDDRVRFCEQCRLNVYNLSDMPRREAEQLVAEREGRLCVRFYRRADGTVLTDNCPVGLRAARRQLRRIIAGYAAMFAMLASAAGLAASRNGRVARLRYVQPFAKLCDWLSPPAAPPQFTRLGVMALPPSAFVKALKQAAEDGQ